MTRGIGRLDAVLISTMVITLTGISVTSTPMRCERARLRCAYRTGCGLALQHYLAECASVLQGNNCTETCKHALIALTSTDEGKELMTCECDDDLCRQSKQRVEVCRASVTTAMNRTRISCTIAMWICNADSVCHAALSFYNRNCKSMFAGRKCTKRCRNSLNILTRQEKAAKLNTCECDGLEDYDCKGIHRNMKRLCYDKMHHGYREVNKVIDETRTNEILRNDDTLRGDAPRIIVDRIIILFSIVIYHILTARRD